MRSRRLAMLSTVTAVAVLLAPTQAVASLIVYGCGVNLCRVAPDGTRRRQITHDGTSTANYRWPSLSRCGQRVSWIRGSDLMLGNADARPTVGPIERTVQFDVIRPDGTQIGALVLSSVFYGLYAYIYDANGAIAMSGPQPDIYSLGWAADGGHVLLPWNDTGSSGVGICVAVENPIAGWDCGERVAGTPNAYLSDPAVSPNGRLLAVTVLGGSSNSSGHIALFDYTTHTYLRDLTHGADDALPEWSPDGLQLAFQRGGSLFVTDVYGKPGTERRLVASGETPTWGGAPDPAARTLTLSGQQRGATVRARMSVRFHDSTIDVRLLGTGHLARRALGHTVVSRADPGARALTVTLNSAGRATLRRAGKLTVMLKITVTTPVGATTRLASMVILRG